VEPDVADNVNKKFGVPDRIQFVVGNGGLLLAKLRLQSGTATEVYLHGAHVANFTTETGQEVFFMSSKAIFNESKAIRGGIPVIFPQFGPGKLPQHGFARNSNDWVVTETRAPSANEASLTLQLKDTEDSRKLWNHSFVATIVVRITYDELNKSRFFQSFSVTNTNVKEEFEFTNALHTYFSIPDIHCTTVTPMNSLTYNDKPTGTVQKQNQDAVQFTGETDRVYHNAPNKLVIHIPNHNIVIEKSDFKDAVLWNAWAELSKTIADLSPDDWKRYVCCEVGNIATPVRLAPSHSWTGSQLIYVQPSSRANV